MAKISWTPGQRAAINTRGRNILVSAAAGSGKTAVLVERIIRRVMRDRERTDIDRMLIVTFTNAAAAEMKEKINRRLRSYTPHYEPAAAAYRGRCRNTRFIDRVERIKLRRYKQLGALDDADICTIDSFCKSCAQSFSHELNIAPDFRICDPAEDSMMIERAADMLIERCYRTSDPCFGRLSGYYGSMRGDGTIREMIIRIYKFLQSYADPMAKLEEIFSRYKEPADNAGEENLDGIFLSDWAQELMRTQQAAVKKLLALFDRYIAETEGEVSDALKSLAQKALIPGSEPLRRIAAADTGKGREAWDEIYYSALSFLQSPPPRPRKVPRKENPGIEEAQAIYDTLFRKRTEFIYIVQPSGDTADQFKTLIRQAEDLKEMVRRLSDETDELKRARSTYSFADIEHMAYRLINDPEYAEISALYRERYTDILIDEYQDTNGLQDAIFAGISRGNNMFMVGDLKQSIYAFRGGDPSIFKKKGAEYTPVGEADMSTSEPVRIDLSDNFRSCQGVVDGINELFGYIMTDELGDVDYSRSGERLRCGRAQTDTDEVKALSGGAASELVYLSSEGGRGARFENGETVNSITVEARYVAQRIKDMVDSRMKIAADGGIREIRYSDITVIANSVKTITNIYSDAFGERGIPLGIPSTGYYDFFEISVVLSFLRVIANRRRDVPLVTVMRSPIGGFTDEELARIAAAGKGQDLYERLVDASRRARGDSSLPAEKIDRFLELIERFDGYKRCKGAAAIVYSIYTETGFYDFAGAMDGGKRAQQNLTLFYEKAKKFEKSGNASLYSFVKYVEKLREESADEEGAVSSNDMSDSVKMMTIHASKGLEFPVVFMVSCGKKFRRQEAVDGILNREAGIGLRYLDTDEKVRTDTPVYRWLQMRNLREARSEDVRKLYVGLTRARERLICVVSGTKTAAEMKELYIGQGKALIEGRRGASDISMADMVSAEGFYVWIMSAYFAGAAEKGSSSAWSYDPDIDTGRFISKDVYSIIRHRYKYSGLTGLPSKTTVSKVREEQSTHTAVSGDGAVYEPRYAAGLDKLPDETESGAVPANVIGTAYHKVMELADPLLCADAEGAAAQIAALCKGGILADETAKDIDPEHISGFFAHPFMGEKIAEAYRGGRLHRETPFEIAIAPDEYDGSAGVYTDDDKVLLQGTIDCWIEDENGECIVIDYKTDAYRGASDDEEAKARFAQEKADEYRVQLELYSRAIELAGNRGIKRKVKEKYLYLFKTGCFKNVEEDKG